MRHWALRTGRLRRWWAACALLLACAAAPLMAGPENAAGPPRWGRFTDIVFRHFTPDTGLPFAGATAIAQDGKGFLWIGSQSGLARWDGQRFRLYQAADGRTGLRDNLVKVLHVDRRGRLWVGLNAAGMARYDPETDRFIPYPAGAHGLSHAGVRGIEDDGRGGEWVATAGGLDRIDPDARTIRRYRHADRDPGSLPADQVSALLRARGGGLWVGTRAGLALLDPVTGRFRPLALPMGRGAVQPEVTALAASGTGAVWIGTAGAGAFRYDPRTRTVARLTEAGPALATQTVTSIAEAGPGEMWIATGGDGVVIADTAAGTARRIVHDAGLPTSLADDAPVALFRDRDGALWIGSQRGLSRHDPTRTGIWTLLGGTSRTGALSNQDVTAALATGDGRIWLGLRSNGAAIVDPSRGTVAPLARGALAALPPTAVSALAERPDGHVILGTNAGLFESDRAGRRIVRFGFDGPERAHEVAALLAEGATLWVGRRDGLWRLAMDGATARAPVRVIESDALPDQRVVAIARGADGALWIGTQNGLARLVPGRGVVERIDLGADALVPTVLADRRGRIWASVYGHGIAVIEQPRRRPFRVRYIDVAQGLPDANVDTLLEDRRGRVWASTDGGLALIDPARMTVRPLERADGVAIDAYWSGSGSATRGGQLLFGGLGGLTVIDPPTIARPRRPAPLAVTEIRIGGERVAEGRVNAAAAQERLTIRPRANSLSVEFATLDYADAAEARYAYRLLNYEDAWTQADAAHRTASYTNLPPGHYLLQIRAEPGSDGGAVPGTDIPVDVLPAWYQTIWFKLALAGLAIGVTLALIQLRTAVLRRRQHQLEQLVADRTAALRASQRELEQIAYIDVLTGLPNRRMFNDAFRACLERAGRRGSTAALLLIDLDHFKPINDTHGHDAGDALLTEVAVRLQAVVGEFDVLARLGGDEFAILVADMADVAHIDELCRRVTEAVAEPVLFGGTSLRSGASIGIALFRRDATTTTELYKAADTALYAAKNKRRGSWAWYGTVSLPPEQPLRQK